jgi:SAM-dependent methyltransferase
MTDHAHDHIRASYDRVAAEYAAHLADELDHKPLDRALLLRFAELVAGRGDVCDLGCGPGHVARFLHDAGVPISGIDLSPGMVEQARRLNPTLAFRVGDMLALDLPDGALAGIVAFYAIVNLAPYDVRRALAEMHRVLAPGGVLLLAFHAGDEVLRPAELWGQPISMPFHLFPPASIVRDVESAGFTVVDVVERDPYPDVEYPSRRCYIFARR